MDDFSPIHPGEHLKEDFMVPNELSANRLAQAIKLVEIDASFIHIVKVDGRHASTGCNDIGMQAETDHHLCCCEKLAQQRR